MLRLVRTSLVPVSVALALLLSALSPASLLADEPSSESPPPTPAVAPTPPSPWVTAADLVAGVYRSHAADPAPVLRFDDAGVYKYLGFHRLRPWTDRARTRQQGYSTLVRGKHATLRFPASASDCAGGCRLHISLFSTTQSNELTPTLNGNAIGSAAVGDRWAVVGFDVPPGGLIDGENELRLSFASSMKFKGKRHAAGLRFIRIDPPGVHWTKPKLPKRISPLQIAGGRHDVLWRAPRTSWYLMLPEQARLRVGLVANRSSGAMFGVDAVTLDDGVKHTLTEPSVVPRDQETEITIDLSEFGGRSVRLDLLWTGTGRAGVVSALVEVHRADTLSVSTQDGPPARNVVVWAIDSLRADQLHVYNPESPVATPRLDAFAQRSVVFSPSLAASTHALPSHASILLGKQPPAHHVYVRGDHVPTKAHLLSELLSAAGLRTALISADSYVSERDGFKQGWTEFTNISRDKTGTGCERVVEAATRFLEKSGGERFFLYLVPSDPHAPYRLKEGLTERYDDPRPYAGRFARYVPGKALRELRAGREISARDRARIKALYQGEIAYSDQCFGALLDALDKTGRTADTAVVVLSDHGEELFEHGSVGHARTLHGEIVSVPFIVGLPGRLLEGVVRSEGAGHIDVEPTVLDLLGVAQPKREVEGMSLLPLLTDPTPALPGAHIADHGEVSRAVQLGPYKLIVGWDGQETLYDLTTDPTEQRDVLTKKPRIARLMRDITGFWARDAWRWRGTSWGNPAFPAPGYRKWLEGGWADRRHR